MKSLYTCLYIGLAMLTPALRGSAQSTFVYDQQSSTNEAPPVARSGVTIQLASPYGQSFRPTLPTIDFVRLKLNDENPSNDIGATISVRLRSDSIGGSIIATSLPATLGDGFAGTIDFLFTNPVSVSPSGTYVFEPVVETGELWNADAWEYNYPDGTAIYQGSVLPGSDLWFREGIIVPEPSSKGLLLLGLSAFAYVRHKKSQTPPFERTQLP